MRCALSPPARCAALPHCSTCGAGERQRRARPHEAEAERSSATRPSSPASQRPSPRGPNAGPSEGFTTFKLKLGAGDDFGQVRAVREAVGPEARIRIDANAAWDVETAERMLGHRAARGGACRAARRRHWSRRPRWRRSTSIPIAGDESVEDRADAERARRVRACRSTGIKLSKVGGPRRRSRSRRCCPPISRARSMGQSGSPPPPRSPQTLARRRGWRHRPRPRPRHPAPLLFDRRLGRVRASQTACSTRPRPGLGVEIDEAALAAHRI